MAELTTEIQLARLDCLMFFHLVQFGWGKVRILSSGAKVAENSPVSGERRLGYPTRHRLSMASKRVRTKCMEEAEQYKRAWREWCEARRRWLATETEESWQWYVAGRQNTNSVAYRTKVDLSHKGGWIHFRARRGFRYMFHELLPRLQERQRARKEMREAQGKLVETKERIFHLMCVPSKFRSLV